MHQSNFGEKFFYFKIEILKSANVLILNSLKLHLTILDISLYLLTLQIILLQMVMALKKVILFIYSSINETHSRGKTVLDVLWHRYTSTRLPLSVNVCGQSLHLAVHSTPDCPSHCPISFSTQ